jgi:hypothetical protein
VTCGHIAEGGQVCSREPGHDGPHGCQVVELAELASCGDDGVVLRSYLVDAGVDPNAELRADTP